MSDGKKLIYIAGPYMAPTACGIRRNVQAAREVADRINRLHGAAGAFAVTPHLLGIGIEDSGDAAFWYAGTLEVMRRCDAVVLMDTWPMSTGAKAERADAIERGMSLFPERSIEEGHLAAWLQAVRS